MSNIGCCTPATSFFTEKLWIEGLALDQWKQCAQLPGMIKALALPDLHPGRGVPIGCALVSQNVFYPHLAGNDLGCGVSAFLLPDLKKGSPDYLSTLKWMKRESDKSLLNGYLNKYGSLLENHGYNPEGHFGTIGGGNHFAEIGTIVDVQENNFGLTKNKFVLLVHSGSRTLGDDVARFWTSQFGIQGSNINIDQSNQWWKLQEACIEWAKLNRKAIAFNIGNTLGVEPELICDTVHNAIEKINGNTIGFPEYEHVYVHRKGASDSKSDLVVLPGSRGDYSYLLKPEATEKSAYSLAHGAGRKWGRSECKGKLFDKFKKDELKRTPLGSRVVCEDNNLLYEEAPQAYKKSSDVLKALEDNNLAKAVAQLKPLVSIKV